MKFWKGLPAFFRPFFWTTTNGRSDLSIADVGAHRLDFLARLVGLSAAECRVFAFDGKQFFGNEKAGASLLELVQISCSEKMKAVIPLVLSTLPPVNLDHKYEVSFQFGKVMTLDIYVEGYETHSPHRIASKFKKLLDIVKSSDVEEGFAQFDAHLIQAQISQDTTANVQARIAVLKEVTHSYQTLETADSTKSALFLKQFNQASQELVARQSEWRAHRSKFLYSERCAEKVIESIKADVSRARKIAILTSHLNEKLDP